MLPHCVSPDGARALHNRRVPRVGVSKLIKQCALFSAALFSGALLSVNAIDSDHNGMSDVWERIYVLDVTAADRDEDHDGWTNQQESALGTDPRDAQSTFYLAIQPGDDP